MDAAKGRVVGVAESLDDTYGCLGSLASGPSLGSLEKSRRVAFNRALTKNLRQSIAL